MVFTFCWPCCHLRIILVNDQLDAQFFFLYVYFNSLTRTHQQENQLYQYNIWYVSICVGERLVRRSGRNSCIEQLRAHHQENQLYQYNIWYVSICVGERLLCRSGRNSCIEQLRAHHQENQLYQYNIWYVSLCVGDRLVCRSGSSFSTCILDSHLHRVTHSRCCIDTIDSPDD
jgi:hypothetical protein